MKIGVLTYHRARNYGAQLQAIALRIALEKLGHQVYYLDYYPNYHRRMYALCDIDAYQHKSLYRKTKYWCKIMLLVFPYWFKRYCQFYKFSRKYIVPYCKPLTKEYDIVIYGSDQIWRKQPYINKYNPIYFGASSIKTDKHISYAASLVDLPSEEVDKHTFLELVSKLDVISVREYPIKEFVENHSSLKCRVDVDPTLLISGKEWTDLFNLKKIINQNYLLLYDLQCDFGAPTFNYEEISNFSKEKGLKIIRLRAKASSWGDSEDRHTDGPLEFLSLVRYADYVFTSSFHGLIFSLLFERQVYCSFPKNSLRAKSLLKELGISHHYLEPNSMLPKPVNVIDYSMVIPKIDRLKKNSLDYLHHIDSI